MQSRTRSYRFSSRRETARSLERSQRIPYFTNSENPEVIFLSGDSSSCCSFLTFANLRCFFFLSFYRRDNQKVAEMVISIVQLQSSIKKTLIIRLHYPTCQTSEMLYNFKEMEETSSLQSLEELKNCRPSLFREEGKRTFVQKSWRFKVKWLVA